MVFIKYGNYRKYGFCITAPQGSENMYDNYRLYGPDEFVTFYFVFFKNIPEEDPDHILSIGVNRYKEFLNPDNDEFDNYLITNAENETETGTWEALIERYPALSEYKNVFKPILGKDVEWHFLKEKSRKEKAQFLNDPKNSDFAKQMIDDRTAPFSDEIMSILNPELLDYYYRLSPNEEFAPDQLINVGGKRKKILIDKYISKLMHDGYLNIAIHKNFKTFSKLLNIDNQYDLYIKERAKGMDGIVDLSKPLNESTKEHIKAENKKLIELTQRIKSAKSEDDYYFADKFLVTNSYQAPVINEFPLPFRYVNGKTVESLETVEITKNIQLKNLKNIPPVRYALDLKNNPIEKLPTLIAKRINLTNLPVRNVEVSIDNIDTFDTYGLLTIEDMENLENISYINNEKLRMCYLKITGKNKLKNLIGLPAWIRTAREISLYGDDLSVFQGLPLFKNSNAYEMEQLYAGHLRLNDEQLTFNQIYEVIESEIDRRKQHISYEY